MSETKQTLIHDIIILIQDLQGRVEQIERQLAILWTPEQIDHFAKTIGIDDELSGKNEFGEEDGISE